MPPIRVIFATSTDRAIHAASQMQREFDWEPVYWLATVQAAPRISGLFPDVLIHDYLQSIKGIWPPSFAPLAAKGVDMDFVRRHASEILGAQYMLERNNSTAGDLSMRERVEFIYQLIAYWTGVLGTLTPDIVVFEEEPHQASDYVLYLVAKHQRINVLMPIRTMPRWGFMLSRGHDGGPLLGLNPHATGASGSEQAIPEYITRYRDAFKTNWTDAKKLMLWDQLDRNGGKPALIRPVLRAIDLARSTIRRLSRTRQYLNNIRSLRSDQKERGKLLRDSELSYFSYVLAKLRTARAKRKNRAAYDRLARRPDYDTPFVYFAMSYQPEKSTSPNGDEFVHQLLAVRTLSASLPDGWQLIVREHPSQFIASNSRHYGEIFRDPHYYESILQFENTSLAPMDTDPYEIMDRAEAVASVGGSSCFEALVRGRRALLFGHAWYVGCPGLSVVRTITEIRQALGTPGPVSPGHDSALDDYFRQLANSIYRAPTAIGDSSLFEQKNALDEYARSYRDFHQHFLLRYGHASLDGSIGQTA
jgi:hypothetical protein